MKDIRCFINMIERVSVNYREAVCVFFLLNLKATAVHCVLKISATELVIAVKIS